MTEQATPAEPRAAPPAATRRVWLKRARNAAILAALVVGAYFVGAALLPRWWSHRVGAQVGGSIAAGIALGLFYGFVFTFLPLVVLWNAVRKRHTWRRLVAHIAGAILLASPNLVTLGIVLGTGNAAHAGERTLDVEAPAYRTSVLVGAIVAAAAFGGLWYLLFSRRLARGRAAKLRAKLKLSDEQSSVAPVDDHDR